MKRAGIKKLVWSVILLVILTVSAYLYKEYNRKPADLLNATPVFSLSATDLVNDFETDEAAANKKYLDKIIQVSGVLSSVSNQQDTLVNITVGDGMHKVGCKLDNNHTDNIQQYQVSKNIIVKGICTGYLMDVELNRCVIIK